MGRDGITGLVILAGCLVLLAATLGLERHPMVPVGPGFYPRIILSITALMAVALLASDVLARRRGTAPAAARSSARYGLVAAAFAVFAAYVMALPFLGFRVATFLFVVAFQALLDPPRTPRRWAIVLVVALLTAAATYFAFERYLQVLLPRGRWTGF